MALDCVSEETPTQILRPCAEATTVIPQVPPGASDEDRTQVDAGPPPGSTGEARAMSKSAPPPPATWAPGAVIPGTIYRVIRPLGVGGMGEVYEAEHELLGVRRALKVLGRRLTSREDLAERLRIEARALARLRHPNLVEVNDLGMSSDGRVFFAMELLAGATLRDLLRRAGALQVNQAIAIATQLLDALDAAHMEGMVHRDVKPENVFVQRSGVVKLLDFGVAKALQGNNQLSPLTAAGVAIGTPRYMAPEQAQGQQVDARSDVYAVGLVLWEMLTGRPPFHHLDALAAVVTAASQGLPDISTTGVTVPADVKAALVRATSRSPDDRYRSAAAFAADLRMARSRLDGTPTTAEKVTARYETSLTSLMPVLSEVTSHDGETSLSGFSDPSFTRTTRVSTTPVNEDATTPGRPSFPEPTEALTLRDSLPFDPREQATPTSIPATSRHSSPSLAPAPVSSQTAPSTPPSRGVPWFALPLVIALSVLATWFLLKPKTQTLPAPATGTVVVSVEPPAPTAPTKETPPAVASASPPDTAPAENTAPAADSTEKPASSHAKAAPKTRTTEPKKTAVPAKNPSVLPGSGL